VCHENTNREVIPSHTSGHAYCCCSDAVGQAEREAMLERQREGIAKAKREGRYKGRVPTVLSRLKAEGRQAL